MKPRLPDPRFPLYMDKPTVPRSNPRRVVILDAAPKPGTLLHWAFAHATTVRPFWKDKPELTQADREALARAEAKRQRKLARKSV